MRKWFHFRGLWLMNRMIGGIVITASVIGFISATVPSATVSAPNVSHSKSINK